MAKKEMENLVVASKLKEVLQSHEVRMAGDFPEAVNAQLHLIAEAAAKRCKANGRSTVRPEDI